MVKNEAPKTRKTKKDYLLEVFEFGSDEQKETLLKIIEDYKKTRAKKRAELQKTIREAKKELAAMGYDDEDDETNE